MYSFAICYLVLAFNWTEQRRIPYYSPWQTSWSNWHFSSPNKASHWLSWFSFAGGDTVYPKKYAPGFCFAVLCCGYTLTDFPITIRLTSPALWQSNDCPSASKATLMNMDKYFMWIHYERLHNHNKAKHNKTVCIFLRIYCTVELPRPRMDRSWMGSLDGYNVKTNMHLLFLYEEIFYMEVICGIDITPIGDVIR